jgi:hypothetical protein
MSDEIAAEIEAMTKSIDALPSPQSEAPPETKTEEKKEEVPPPAKDEKKEEVPPETPPVETPPEEKKEEPPPEPSPLEAEVAQLKAEIAALKATKEPEKKADEKPTPPIQETFVSTDEDLDELTRDPAKLNEKLNQVFQKGMQAAEAMVLSKLPEVVAQQVEVIQKMQATSTKFYQEHSDLEGFKNVVKVVYDDVIKNNPNLTLDQALKNTAKETRKRLNLPEPKPQGKKQDLPPPPPTPGKSAGSVHKEAKSDNLSDELSEMDKAINQ